MNYIDSGSSIASKNFVRKSSKKTSLFFQQAQKDKEEQQYEKNVDEFQIFINDSSLLPFKEHFKIRNEKFFETLDQIIKLESTLVEFSSSFNRYGFQVTDIGIQYREYAPSAKAVSIFGNFNNYNKTQYQAEKNEVGLWEIFLQRNSDDWSYPLNQNSEVQVLIIDELDNEFIRIPLWAKESKFNELETIQYGKPLIQEYQQTMQSLNKPEKLSVKQLSNEKFKVIQKDFKKYKQEGYNSVMLKYQESSFIFSPNPKQGNTEEFQKMVDEAHMNGLNFLLEVNYFNYYFPDLFDGTELYGKEGIWDYSKWETMRILLSNVRYWISKCNVDGLVFKNVSEAIYGKGKTQKFTALEDYFIPSLNIDALVFFLLANDIAKQTNQNVILIADDEAGYPYIDQPIRSGGLGFNFKLQNISFSPFSSNLIQIEEEQKL